MAGFTIRRLNHLVLWVRDAQRSLGFYRDVLGFAIVELPSPQAVFLRAREALLASGHLVGQSDHALRTS